VGEIGLGEGSGDVEGYVVFEKGVVVLLLLGVFEAEEK